MLSRFWAPAAVAAALMAAASGLWAQGPVLVWSDDFNQAVGSGPDPTKWNFDLGVGDPPGWGNNELETYTNSRGNSVIVADPDALDGKALAIRAQSANGSYTSARIQTETTFSVEYGRLECRAKLPTGVGLWPAFWALGSDINTAGWPDCGEIDVMEWVGQFPNQIAGSLNLPVYNGGTALTADYILGSGAYSDAYHVFAVDWYPGEFVFSVDGTVYEVQKQSSLPAGSAWPYSQPFFLLLNLAVGGNWPGPPDASTVFPQDFRVDYVRVFSLPAAPPASLVWPPDAPAGLAAYSPAAGQVALSWTAPANTYGAALTGYRIDRANDAGFATGLVSWSVGAGGTTYTDTTGAAGATYYYRVTAISADGASAASTAAQSAVLGSVATAQLINISARALVGGGANELIGGFIVSGGGAQTVLVRASGPALGGFGIAGYLPDPELQVFSGSTVIASDTGWGGNPVIAAAAASVGAFPWGDSATPDSALVVTLTPGAYTAIVSGASGDGGVSLLEVYAIDPAQ